MVVSPTDRFGRARSLGGRARANQTSKRGGFGCDSATLAALRRPAEAVTGAAGGGRRGRHLTRRLSHMLLLCCPCSANDPVCAQVDGLETEAELIAEGSDGDGTWSFPFLSVVRTEDDFVSFWEERSPYLWNVATPDEPDTLPEWIDGMQLVLFWWDAGPSDPVREPQAFYNVDGVLVVDFLVSQRCSPNDAGWEGVTKGVLFRTAVLSDPTQCDVPATSCFQLE